jgi:hypothetical protein
MQNSQENQEVNEKTYNSKLKYVFDKISVILDYLKGN